MPNASKSRHVASEEERIREIVAGWFKSSGMTQQKVAERTGMSQPAVSAFFLGKRFGSLDNLKALCECFGHPLADLFDDSDGHGEDREAEQVMLRYRRLPPSAQRAVLDVMEAFSHKRRAPK